MRESLLLELTLVTGALCTRELPSPSGKRAYQMQLLIFCFICRQQNCRGRELQVYYPGYKDLREVGLTIRPPVTTALRFDDLGVYMDDQKLLLG